MKLNPQVASTMQKSSFDDLMQSNPSFRAKFSRVNEITPINTTYFQKSSGQIGFDFTVKVINVDPKIEKLIFNYGGKSYSYSHGPLETFKATWPSTSSKKVGFTAYINEKRVGKVEADSEWGLMKLIENGNVLINNRSKSVVKYSIDNKDVIVEFNSATNNNPFYLNELRRFSCV